MEGSNITLPRGGDPSGGDDVDVRNVWEISMEGSHTLISALNGMVIIAKVHRFAHSGI
jgi:hypothetical protein